MIFFSNASVNMEPQEIYSVHSSYDSCQESDYIYDSQDDCSDSSDSYGGSFIDDSELNDDAYYIFDQGNIRHFIDRNILEAEKELGNINLNARQPRINLK